MNPTEVLEMVAKYSRAKMEANKDLVMFALNSPEVKEVISNSYGDAETCYASLLASKKKKGSNEPSALLPSIENYVRENVDILVKEYIARTSREDSTLEVSNGASYAIDLPESISVQGTEIKRMAFSFRIFQKPEGYKRPKKTVTTEEEITIA